ncbi:hypothetical protein [Kaarinaea lacus]
MSFLFRLIVFYVLMLPVASVQAVDSYRYAHVTIDTPWNIFLFLLVIILLPFILMAILYWHFAIKGAKEKKEQDNNNTLDESKKANE